MSHRSASRAFRPRALLAAAIFALAALTALAGATWAVGVLEKTAQREIAERLGTAGLDWAEVETDGLLVTLTGTADSEADRFRALSVAVTVVDAARVIDAVQVAEPEALAPPRFSMEILRNDDGVSLIGLVPEAFGRDGIRARIARLTDGAAVTDMLESANHPAPEGWAEAVAFGLDALALLPRSKISIAADRVAVTAIADSRDERRTLETRLARAAPDSVVLSLDISAPRPVIAPFTLRFVIDERGPRFDACAADTEAARTRIVAAGVAAGARGQVVCTIGLGVPSPEWAAAAEAALAALGGLGAGTVTFSDADVTLVVPHEVEEEAFDAAVGRLDAALPAVFSLEATRLPAPVEETPGTVAPEFTARLSEEGDLLLRGRIGDAQMRDAALGLARARFGASAVQAALRLDPELPSGWSRRVMTAIEALAELHDGSVTVTESRLAIEGRSGNPDVSDSVAGLLADKLGGGVFSIDIRYDERLDPVAMAPSPERCIADIEEILAERQITFAPGSARIEGETAGTVDKIAAVLRECGPLELEIAGHTDSQGRAEMNLALSQRRAEAVLDALLARRVPVSGFGAVGYGQERPIADNATAAGREANRRIEFRLARQPEPEPTEEELEEERLARAAAEAELEVPVASGRESPLRPRLRPDDLETGSAP